MIQDKASNSNLKIEALVFTRLVMASHSPAVFHPHIKVCYFEVYSYVTQCCRRLFGTSCCSGVYSDINAGALNAYDEFGPLRAGYDDYRGIF